MEKTSEEQAEAQVKLKKAELDKALRKDKDQISPAERAVRQALLRRIELLEATIERIEALPDKWRKSGLIANAAGDNGLCEGKLECADELEALSK